VRHAVTSFDKVVSFLTFPRWKWLQRLVYLCGVFIIVHVWAIGVHFGAGVIQNVVFGALVFCLGWKLGALRPSWLGAIA